MITVILTGALYVSRDFPFSADFPLPLHSARRDSAKRKKGTVITMENGFGAGGLSVLCSNSEKLRKTQKRLLKLG